MDLQQYLSREAQSVVISGAAGGVGKVLVEYFTQKGAQVFGIDSIQRDIPATEMANLKYTMIHADLSKQSEARKVKEIIITKVTEIDILVNGAGIFIPDAFSGEMDQSLMALWQHNVLSATYLSNELYPLLVRARKPLVVNISSTDGVIASAGQDCEIGVRHDTFYATTKGALIALTRSLAMKWAKDNVRVNAICPTIIRTPMSSDLLSTSGKEAELSRYIPLGRICEPIDVAIAVECLYQLEMTTAHVLPLDGGYLCL